MEEFEFSLLTPPLNVAIGTSTSSPRKCKNAIVQVRAVGKMYGMYTLYPPVASPVVQQTVLQFSNMAQQNYTCRHSNTVNIPM